MEKSKARVSASKLKRRFYIQPTLKVAKDLLGKYIVRYWRNKYIVGKIVETEAYIGPKDRAAHSFGGKITPRNKVEYLIGGYVYIYLVYGMYWQFNITTAHKGKPECVLIRACQPICNQKHLSFKKLVNLANGPGKLCRYFHLNKSFYGEDLVTSARLWLEDRGEKVSPGKIVKTTRIGIDYAKEWAKKPWRFYISENPFVSRL